MEVIEFGRAESVEGVKQRRKKKHYSLVEGQRMLEINPSVRPIHVRLIWTGKSFHFIWSSPENKQLG